MSIDQRWRLPPGFEALLPPKATRLEGFRRSILNLFDVWGYELVVPPMIDYLQALHVGAGEDLQQQTFVITDKCAALSAAEKQDWLGIRADITPQVARIDAHSMPSSQVSRLCYCDYVFQASPKRLSDLRMVLQSGVELFGHDGVVSDLEIIELLISVLAELGVTDFHLDIGHVGILEAIITADTAITLSSKQRSQLLSIFERKSQPDLVIFLAAQGLSNELMGEKLQLLMQCYGDPSVLLEARSAFKKLENMPDIEAIFDDLDFILNRLKRMLPEHHIIIDLAESRGFNYHTGLVFAAYMPGIGGALAKGGRYNKIGQAFGQARPATGFSLDLLKTLRVKDALNLDEGQDISDAFPCAIYAPPNRDEGCNTLVADLRAAGERVIAGLKDGEDVSALGCDRQLVKSLTGGWEVQWLTP